MLIHNNREQYCLDVKETGIELEAPDVILSKEILRDKTLSDEAFLVYTAIKTIQQGRYVETSLNQLYYKLVADCSSMKEQNNRKLREKIKRGFDELVRLGLIKIMHQTLDQFTVDCVNLKMVTEVNENFVTLTRAEIRIIMNIPNIQADKLIRYFSILKSTINIKSHIGFAKICELAKCVDVARQTVYRFNKILEEKKLIYIVHNKDSNVCNYYSLYEYRDVCINYANNAGYKIF